jgi:ABC-type sugar transport system ATPase subunit
MPNYARARWGLRRTSQTEQAIEALSVFDNVAIVHENCSSHRASRRSAVLDAIEFVGLDVDPDVKVGTLGARDRRLVEIARAVVGEPRVVLLDEPAAGLPEEETGHMSRMIQRMPEQRGALVILVDHDMSLVSACCQQVAVLDFGKLIASGETTGVLRNEHVMRSAHRTVRPRGARVSKNGVHPGRRPPALPRHSRGAPHPPRTPSVRVPPTKWLKRCGPASIRSSRPSLPPPTCLHGQLRPWPVRGPSAPRRW